MSGQHSRTSWARRSFLSRIGTGAAVVGAAFGAGASSVAAQTPASPAGPWQPARHPEDDWLEQPPAKHRFFLDTTTPDALGMALVYANNYFTANRSGYNLADSDVSVVICARHQSTAFAFTDAMWAKYGPAMAEQASFTNPSMKQPPTVNIYQATGSVAGLVNRGVTLDSLFARGVRLAVCQMATRGIAMRIAQKMDGNADDIFKELVANRVPNTHMVAAGIVAVNRAQERGYSFSYVG